MGLYPLYDVLDHTNHIFSERTWNLIARIMSSQKIYGLCGLKHHIVEIRDHVTGAGQTTNNEQRTTNNEQTMEDRATQLMEARRMSFAKGEKGEKGGKEKKKKKGEKGET